VICLDGWDPAYLTHSLAAGELPAIARCIAEGFHGPAVSAMPSFANPNIFYLDTGVPPALHGVSGNTDLDRVTGETVMVTGDAELRAPTILAALADAGVTVAIVIAKDKLRRALAKRLPIGAHGIADLAERAAEARLETHGVADLPELVGAPVPAQYSAELSLFVLPIAGPLVRHDDALGGFVRVYLAEGGPTAEAVIDCLQGVPGIHLAMTGAQACELQDLVPEMEGDVAVFGARGIALGARAAEHDLGQLAGERLRSHGGLFDCAVPFLLSRPLDPAWQAAHPAPRNYDIIDAALNGTPTP
jgi:hypothetical protein